LDRFRREAEAVAQLQHPHVVQIYEVGEAEGRPYFSLEFVEGGSLADKLDGTPLAPQQAAQLLETLARAMQAAHQRRSLAGGPPVAVAPHRRAETTATCGGGFWPASGAFSGPPCVALCASSSA
jgi:serine/threonine protein kinase